MIRAISDTAFSLFGLPRDAVTAACALPVLRTQTAECAPALSVLAAASGIASDEAGDKENAESFLSALDRLLYSTLGFQRTLPCLQEEDLRRLVVESLDALCNCGTSPRYCEEEWTLILSRIFLDNRK